MFKGQVWLSIEDTDRDGRDDTWSYYRSGVLVSVYHDAEEQGRADVRELYKKGILNQVQAKSAKGKGVEFVLFPAEGSSTLGSKRRRAAFGKNLPLARRRRARRAGLHRLVHAMEYNAPVGVPP